MTDEKSSDDDPPRLMPGLWRLLEQASEHTSPWAPPPSRPGSIAYEPTLEQRENSALLASCYGAGLTESQTIEMLWRELRRRETQVERLAEMQTPAPIVIMKDPER